MVAPRTREMLDSAITAAIGGPGMRVVLYMRVSPHEKGEVLSVPQQRKAGHEHAARNKWVIVDEYVDAGKSGSKDRHRRTDFQRLLEDSAKGEWSAVLCWDTSRFTREDPIESAEAKRILRANGVHLESVNEGRIDWNTQMGRMLDFVKSEQNHDFSVKIGSNSLRGRQNALAGGYWPHGVVPFGYSRQYWHEGTLKLEQRRTEKAQKVKGWKCKIVPFEAEAAHVRWLYDQWVNSDVSRRWLAMQMNQRTPGITWNKDTIRDVLRNPANCGDVAIGYSRMHRDRKAFNKAERTIVRDGCPALVSRQVWEAAQTKLDEQVTSNRRVHVEKASPLSGVIFCGHCGHVMGKRSRRNGATGTYFRCDSPLKRPHLGCKQHETREDVLMPIVQQHLVAAIDGELLRKAAARPEKRDTEAEAKEIREKLAELDGRIKKGSENMLLADPSLFSTLNATLQTWKDEREKLANTLNVITKSDGRDELAELLAWWEEVRANVVQAGTCDVDEATIPMGDDRKALLVANQKARLMIQLPKDTIHTRRTINETGREVVAVSMGKGAEVVLPTDWIGPILKPDVFRNILKKLNARLYLHWTTNGKNYSRLTTVDVEAEVCRHTHTMAAPSFTSRRGGGCRRISRTACRSRTTRAFATSTSGTSIRTG